MKILVEKGGEWSRYSTLPKRRAFWISHLWGKGKKHDVSGFCRVAYTREYWNEFFFDDFEDFKRKLEPCLEEDMLKEFSVGKDK